VSWSESSDRVAADRAADGMHAQRHESASVA
jgi:hypothetical protein